jgi:hypothetical protein
MNGIYSQLCKISPGTKIDIVLKETFEKITGLFIKCDPDSGCVILKDPHHKNIRLNTDCICAFSTHNSKRNKREFCCKILMEHKTQLVPPAKKGTSRSSKIVEAEIEKVCQELVVICGVIHKTITYTAILDGKEVPGYKICDDVPFQCLIECEDINECESFRVTKKEILCEVSSYEANFGGEDHSFAFKHVEKDIVKVCVVKE